MCRIFMRAAVIISKGYVIPFFLKGFDNPINGPLCPKIEPAALVNASEWGDKIDTCC